MNPFPIAVAYIIATTLCCAASNESSVPYLYNYHPGGQKEKCLFIGSRGHKGERGERGRKGERGHRGRKGLHGPGVAPAYIERAEVIATLFPLMLTSNTVLPLGNLDNGITPVLLEYVDPSPSDTTADRYIHVLPGGAGKYLIEYSFLAQVLPMEIQLLGTPPTEIQLQVAHDGGPYDTTRLLDLFPGIIVDLTTTYSGTRTDILDLQDNDKVHIVVLNTDATTTIGGLPQDRVVNVTMARIG